MPNGGHICCEYCTYNRLTPGKCDVFGVDTSPFVLCRMFRTPGQPHEEARKQWPMLNDLERGVVYGIDNRGSTNNPPPPVPIFKMRRVKENK